MENQTQITMQTARMKFINELACDPGLYETYKANIAMLLHDRHGITGQEERNRAADDILNLLFPKSEATYLPEIEAQERQIDEQEKADQVVFPNEFQTVQIPISERIIVHMEVGTHDWCATPEEINALVESFKRAGQDPLGAVVATRRGVKFRIVETGSFAEDIQKFNAMYRMPVNPAPTLDIGMDLLQRLKDFKSILGKELNEIDQIIVKVENNVHHGYFGKLEVLTDMADLFGDIQVYCASEMAKFGLPLVETLNIIMQSNFSKMGADGQPIYDAQNKLQKGPNYWKPEPKICELIHARIVEYNNATTSIGAVIEQSKSVE